jgi:hypothetical protein
MSKQIKHVVAVVITNKDKPGEFLVVKRPDDDPDLRDEWINSLEGSDLVA